MQPDPRAARVAYLAEQLAALDGYGNAGDDPRAAAIRDELAELAPVQTRPDRRRPRA